jgi:hypothetical protein
VNDAVWRFARDLADAGMSAGQRAVLALIYDRALTAGSAASWTRLYRVLFSALRLLARSAPAGPFTPALESVLRIVEDDFGLKLFGPLALRRLRASLGLRKPLLQPAAET